MISVVILLINACITYWIWCMKKSGNFCLQMTFVDFLMKRISTESAPVERCLEVPKAWMYCSRCVSPSPAKCGLWKLKT